MAWLGTIGYEGYDHSEWMSTLAENEVEAVVDVRDVPLSRKRGFSKSQLATALECVGIEYLHLRALGNPRSYREALKHGMDFKTFAGEFLSLLDEREEALGEVLSRAQESRVCLLCFEEDPQRCHRSLVADRLSSRSGGQIEVVHLRH
jgi:uncharacterized protein (DUF488 family)